MVNRIAYNKYYADLLSRRIKLDRNAVSSSDFFAMLELCREYFVIHLDSKPAKNVLTLLRRSNYFKPVKNWFRDAYGIDIKYKDNKVEVNKCIKKQGIKFEDYVSKYRGTYSGKKTNIKKYTKREELIRLFKSRERKFGSVCVQGGAPGLGKKH